MRAQYQVQCVKYGLVDIIAGCTATREPFQDSSLADATDPCFNANPLHRSTLDALRNPLAGDKKCIFSANLPSVDSLERQMAGCRLMRLDWATPPLCSSVLHSRVVEFWASGAFLEFCVGLEAVEGDNERMRAMGDETKGHGRQ